MLSSTVVALAFAPISLFFRITAPDYAFFKLLNVAILGLSALIGLRFLTGGMRVLNEHGLLAPQPKDIPAEAPVSPAVAPVAAPVAASVRASVGGKEPVPAGAGA